MCGTQLDNIPHKSLSCVEDFESVVNSITQQDVQLLVSHPRTLSTPWRASD